MKEPCSVIETRQGFDLEIQTSPADDCLRKR